MTAAERAAQLLLKWSARFDPALQRVILDVWSRVVANVSAAELERLIANGDTEAVVRLLFDSPEANAANVAIRNVYAQAVQTIRTAAIKQLALRVEAPIADPRLVELVREWEDQAFRRIKADVREGLRSIVADELTRGIGPRQLAVALKQDVGMVGLTAYDQKIVQSFRKALEEGRIPDALQRTLRDRRYDRSLRKPLSPAQIDKMVSAYRRKLVAFRAVTLARTAALDAANAATDAAWEAAVEQGRVPLERIKRFWIVAEDERLCKWCQPIPGLNPDGVGLREQFRTPQGLIKRPTRHPNCRCTVWVRVVRPNVVQRPRPGSTRLILPKLVGV